MAAAAFVSSLRVMLLVLWCLHLHPDRVLLRLPQQFIHPRVRTQWTRQTLSPIEWGTSAASTTRLTSLCSDSAPSLPYFIITVAVAFVSSLQQGNAVIPAATTPSASFDIFTTLCHFLLLSGGFNFGFVFDFLPSSA